MRDSGNAAIAHAIDLPSSQHMSHPRRFKPTLDRLIPLLPARLAATNSPFLPHVGVARLAHRASRATPTYITLASAAGARALAKVRDDS